jgi:MarR family transcriptional regulator for hemolysin
MRQKDLAASLSLDTSSIVRVLDELETSGLIERREGVDRRTKAVHLTPLGQTTVQRVEEIVRGVRERALTGVSDADMETVVRVLHHVCGALSPTIETDAA